MSDTSQLGITCPQGGNFYVCTGNKTEFIGCCKSNPCADGSGTCPTADLTAASFDESRYANIPAQDCQDARGASVWFTCKFNDPPFLGCCASDPCQAGKCAQDNLIAAKLSSNPTNRLVFDPSATSTPSAGSDTSGHRLSTGAIVGIAVGGAVLVIAIVALIMYRCGWLARNRREDNAHMDQLQPTGYAPVTTDPYRASYQTTLASGTIVPSSYHGSPALEEYERFKHHSGQFSPDSAAFGRPFSSIGSQWHGEDTPRGYYTPNLMSPDPAMTAFPSEIDGREHRPPVSELAADHLPAQLDSNPVSPNAGLTSFPASPPMGSAPFPSTPPRHSRNSSRLLADYDSP
ncbi:hypothetical protein GQ53DRAFT_756633, partial [Thozetella sp. PMI_491]